MPNARLPDNPEKIAQSVAAIYIPELAEKVLVTISDKEPGFKSIVESLFAKPDTTNLNFGLFTKEYAQKSKAFLKANLEMVNLAISLYRNDRL